MHMCVLLLARMAQGYLYRNGAKALFRLLTNGNPIRSSACVQSRDCTHTIDGRELTNRHNSIRELLMLCVCVLLARMAQGYLYRNSAKALISPTHKWQSKPMRCVESRDCTHTIDGRELTNRHNSIRELLMHMCVCCCLPGWHRVTCIATVQKH